jgi:hypothetical protein
MNNTKHDEKEQDINILVKFLMDYDTDTWFTGDVEKVKEAEKNFNTVTLLRSENVTLRVELDTICKSLDALNVYNNQLVDENECRAKVIDNRDGVIKEQRKQLTNEDTELKAELLALKVKLRWFEKENEDQTNVINSCDGVIKWQNDKILKLEKMIEYGLGKEDLKDEH